MTIPRRAARPRADILADMQSAILERQRARYQSTLVQDQLDLLVKKAGDAEVRIHALNGELQDELADGVDAPSFDIQTRIWSGGGVLPKP